MANNDAQDLGRFGYAQELFRSMGGFSNFAISFSTISILTGVGTLYGYGLEMGGPLQMTLGWPIATLFTLAIAASLAELCSAYPTSGAMYHWASALGGPAPFRVQRARLQRHELVGARARCPLAALQNADCAVHK